MRRRRGRAAKEQGGARQAEEGAMRRQSADEGGARAGAGARGSGAELLGPRRSSDEAADAKEGAGRRAERGGERRCGRGCEVWVAGWSLEVIHLWVSGGMPSKMRLLGSSVGGLFFRFYDLFYILSPYR